MPEPATLRFCRAAEFERDRWWKLYALFAVIGLFFGAHFTLDVRSGDMALAEAVFAGMTTAMISGLAILFVRRTRRGRLELTLDERGLVYIVGSVERRLPGGPGALELLETARTWVFVHPQTGATLSVLRAAFPQVRDELSRHPALRAAVRVTGGRTETRLPLRTKVLSAVVLLFALAYFALMIFGLLAKAGLLDTFSTG